MPISHVSVAYLYPCRMSNLRNSRVALLNLGVKGQIYGMKSVGSQGVVAGARGGGGLGGLGGGLDRGSPCCVSIIRNANVACLRHLFKPICRMSNLRNGPVVCQI